MKAALYARVSREEQMAGHSVDEQLDDMRAFCQEQGWGIVTEYIEPGFTGETEHRPVFHEVLAVCEAKQIDVLVVHNMDRFFRNLMEKLQVLARFSTWGIVFAAVQENLIVTDVETMPAEDWLLLAMKGTFSQYFLKNLRREVVKGKRGRAKAGLTNASQLPWGYVREDNGQDVIDEEKRDAVQAVFQMYATGAYSFRSLATALNELHPRDDCPWSRYNVAYLLRNPFYTGQVQHHGQLYPGQHEAIISPELFERVQAAHRQRVGNASQYRPKSARTQYLLSGGLLVCHTCGTPMWVESHKSRLASTYYLCPARDKAIECADSRQYLQMPLVHEQMEALVLQLRLPDDWQEHIVELSNHKEEKSRAERLRAQLQGRITRLTNAYVWQGMDEADYQNDLRHLQDQLARLQVPDTPAIVQAGTYLESLAGLWPDMDDRERREVVHILFGQVRLDVQSKQIVCVQVKPHFVPLFRLDSMKELEERENGYFYLPGTD